MSTPLPILQPQHSPFIPRPIDNTALDAYMSCPRKYYYSMALSRRGTGAERPALAYGTCWHAIMEAHYKTAGNTDAVTAAAHASWKAHDNPDDHRTLERCVSEYGNFIARYGSFEAEARNWGDTVGFPDTPIVERAVELWWPGLIHPYVGKIDRIFTYQGLFYVEDHKTTSAMGPTYFKQFDPSNQMMGYAVLAQKLTGLPIAGVRINAHAVLKGSSKFERQTIHYSQDRLAEWERNLNSWLLRLEASHREVAVLTENPEFGGGMIEAAEAAFPHNFNACAGKYGQCSYSGVCTFDPGYREQILDTEYEERPWNPLNPDGDSNE